MKMQIKRLLPTKTELLVLAVLSLLLAAMVMTFGTIDTLLLVVTAGLFISCALLGMHRSGRLLPLRQELPRPEQKRNPTKQ